MSNARLDDHGSAVPTAGAVDDELDLAARLARRGVAEREAELAKEVRRLMRAAQQVFTRCGTRESPRLTDIIAEAGLSNDAFYRHFKSKDELVTAIMEDGTARFKRQVAERMQAVDDPAEKVRVWIRSMLGQAQDPELIESVRTVMWNAERTADDSTRRVGARASLAQLLVEPVAALGSADPARDAFAVCAAARGRLEHFMWRREVPTSADVDHVVTFCLRAIG